MPFSALFIQGAYYPHDLPRGVLVMVTWLRVLIQLLSLFPYLLEGSHCVQSTLKE